MTVHVFIGVGPANLHRALKIQKIDPQAKLVFIDNRIRLQTRDIDREKARANIFRFEIDDVTAKLLAAGIREEDLKPLIHQREFSVAQGFQSGDDRVFAAKPFTQIQIRDLQLLLMKTMDRIGAENRPILISQKVGEHGQSISEEVAGILYEQRAELGINPEEMQDIKIHVATGALTGDAKKQEIIYPDKAHYQMENASDDVLSMPVVPVHGTTTFVITDKISLDQLKDHQRSLDLSEWEMPLKQFGWNLIRPPRIRVFYANDILYIGAEIPIQMNNIKDKKDFEKQVTEYTRTIAELVFPGLDINSLPVNPNLRSRFPTERGETGDVLKTTPDQIFPWGDMSHIRANVTVLTHGDSRYLPHYQTGSGFVTAFLQNELYAEIYGRNTFAELVDWAIKEKGIAATTDPVKLEKIYKDKTGQNAKLALEAFQQELFMAFSRDIIERNKERVGRYFNAIHTQALDALGARIDELLNFYNKLHGTELSIDQFPEVNTSLIAMELLHSNNINFLRKVLPQLLNKDFSTLSDQEILHIRDMHLLDFDKNLGMEPGILTPSKKVLSQVIHEAVTKAKLKLAEDKLTDLLIEYNKIHKTNYKEHDFNGSAKEILIMEMLNRNKANVSFLRQFSPLLFDRDLSHLNDDQVLRIRDEFTKDYPKLVNLEPIIEEYSDEQSLHDLVKNLAGAQGKLFNKVAADLKLPIIAKESDAEELRKNLLHTAMNQLEHSHDPFLTNMKTLLAEKSDLLTVNLLNISESLKNNKAIHQRSFFSFFTGKHSQTIDQFAVDMDNLVTKYKTKPEQLKIEALSTMMKFHHDLEQGHSRRTKEAFMLEISDAIETAALEKIF